jgi:Na+/H+-dicarboxylate symporter
VCSPSGAPGPSGRSRFRIPLSLRVILGVAIGITLGMTFRSQPILFGLGNDDLGPLGLLVIRLLKALATPLILFAVLDSFLKTKLTGASARRLLGTCLVNVTVAMVIGLTILNVFRPGAAWSGHIDELLTGISGSGAAIPKVPEGTQPTLNPLKNLAGYVPESVVDPIARNNVVPLVLLAVLAGAALRRLKDHPPLEAVRAIETVADVVDIGYRTLITVLMWVAHLIPIAVALIIAQVVGRAGIGVFAVLWPFLMTVLAGLFIHWLIYYPAVAWFVGRRSPRVFFGRGADAIVSAFSINSSLATMPITLRCLAGMGVSAKASRLSACVGSNFNNDGVMLYEAIAALFLCQALGYDLSFSSQLIVVLASIMAGVGIAGIPEAGLIVLPLVLTAAGLPEAAIAAAIPLIVPVDWIIARVRSAVNVTADMLVAIVLDRLGERD